MQNTLLALVFLLFALCSQILLGAAHASPEQVVDTHGKELRAGSNYYIILPPSVPHHHHHHQNFHTSEALGLASIGSPCPLDPVVVNNYGYPRGLTLTFTPVNPKKGVIRVSTDLNIRFSAQHTSTCPRYSTVWTLEFDAYKNKGQWFVTTGGVVGNPGLETIHNWFKIEKYDGAYKLVYCPSLLPRKHLCKDVGVFVDHKGNKRLALSGVPLKVEFQEA